MESVLWSEYGNRDASEHHLSARWIEVSHPGPHSSSCTIKASLSRIPIYQLFDELLALMAPSRKHDASTNRGQKRKRPSTWKPTIKQESQAEVIAKKLVSGPECVHLGGLWRRNAVVCLLCSTTEYMRSGKQPRRRRRSSSGSW